MIDGNLIKKLRNEKNLTQDELGELIGASGNIVSRWEREKATPSHYYVQKLSEFFEKPIDFFIKGINSGVKERSITENKGMLIFELGSQRLEVPATEEFSTQFWEKVDKMIEIATSRKDITT